MAGNIQPLLTVNSGARTPVVAATHCTDIQVQESPTVANWPTTDYLVAKPAGGNQRRITIGGVYTFHKDQGVYQPGETAGDLQTVAGSTSFIVDEGGVG